MKQEDKRIKYLENQLAGFYSQSKSYQPSSSWKSALMQDIRALPLPNVIYMSNFVWRCAYGASLVCLMGLAFLLIYNPSSEYDLIAAQMIDIDGQTTFITSNFLAIEEVVL